MDKKSVLVVDDERDICMILSAMLEKKGFDVSVAYSHETAEKIIDEIKNKSIAFIDINLPDGDGYSLATRLKKKSNDAIVYLISARETPEDSDLKQSMADGFISKPFSKKEIFEAINNEEL
ncbi:response regulator [Marinigracilibium pacificum]|uniref:Response regulator n=1 Tax=Marinigracilibium pacificum TaxID=2729599 RepID=A0A848IUH6_9BACT|nr:response regulator [Marinigracilibium pacificum]NMM47987.1 response regulator [Marinigracilibium pacificum]